MKMKKRWSYGIISILLVFVAVVLFKNIHVLSFELEKKDISIPGKAINIEEVGKWITDQGKEEAESYYLEGLSYELMNLDQDEELEVLGMIEGGVHLGEFFVFDKTEEEYILIQEESWKVEKINTTDIEIDGIKMFEIIERTGGTGVDVFIPHLFYISEGRFVEAWEGIGKERVAHMDYYLDIGNYEYNNENQRLYAWSSSYVYDEDGITLKEYKGTDTFVYRFDGTEFVLDFEEQNRDKDEQPKNTNLIRDMEQLMKEKNIGLKIKKKDGRYYKTTDFFAQRILARLDGRKEWKDKNLNEHDLVLQFDGYEEIYVYLKGNTFWFKGADMLYRSRSFAELWERAQMTIIDQDVMYTGFEKTVIKKGIFDFDEDNEWEEVTLFYDGDVRLRVNEADIIIYEDSSEDTIENLSIVPSLDDIGMDLDYDKENNMLLFTHQHHTIKGTYVSLRYYKYIDEQLSEVWSTNTDQLGMVLKEIKPEENSVVFDITGLNDPKEIYFTETEKDFFKKKVEDLKRNGIEINDSYVKDIKDNIFISHREFRLVDYDQDGQKELILLSEFKIAGAITAFTLRDDVFSVMEISNQNVEPVGIFLGREKQSQKYANYFK